MGENFGCRTCDHRDETFRVQFFYSSLALRERVRGSLLAGTGCKKGMNKITLKLRQRIKKNLPSVAKIKADCQTQFFRFLKVSRIQNGIVGHHFLRGDTLT